MLTYKNVDITTITSGFVLHGCNCQGVMGSGVALSIKRKWPEAFTAYRSKVDNTALPHNLLGQTALAKVQDEPLIVVVNLFTQFDYGRDNRRYAEITAVRESLKETAMLYRRLGDSTFPVYSVKVGCGLGGLDWDDEVRPVYEFISANYAIPITICTI